MKEMSLKYTMAKVFTSEEFEQRAKYMIDTVALQNQEKPVIAISIFPNCAEYKLDKNNSSHIRNMEFMEILKRICRDSTYKNLYFIEGRKILTDPAGLSCDLLHPSDYGHILMGENLAKELKRIL